MQPAIADDVAQYRAAREYVERSVLALATSVDGVSFEFQASLHGLALRRGGYVVLESPGTTRLGQVTDLRAQSQTVERPHADTVSGSSTLRVSLATGAGTVLHGSDEPFHDATVRVATPAEVGAWTAEDASDRAGLRIGELLRAPGVPLELDSGGLSRHTFMCGQSGSGKTYSLGVLLEQVLAETRLRVVVVDPNSDYVGLGDLRPGADPTAAEQYADVPAQVEVWRDTPAAQGAEQGGPVGPAGHPLRLRFSDLLPTAQAAVLGLDPVRDRDEYAVLVELLRRRPADGPLLANADELLTDDRPGARELGVRATNLGITDWSLWSRGEGHSLVEEMVSPTQRCAIVDTGSLGSLQEQRLVSQAVLAALWRARAAHTPTLVVLDEAHNVCPAHAEDPVARLTAETAIQIAAEGRKYGLYLLLSTQQPHKVHPDVVAQCDNLLLMRMNSQADLTDLTSFFSFVPPGLIEGALAFRQGQALVAGKLVSHPAYVAVGDRLTREGGADLPRTWAEPRPRASR